MAINGNGFFCLKSDDQLGMTYHAGWLVSVSTRTAGSPIFKGYRVQAYEATPDGPARDRAS